MLATNIGTGMVIGQFGIGVVDGPDDDQDPDVVPLAGSITFTPSVQYLPNPSAAPNAITIVTAPIKGVLDEEGYLCTPAADGVTPQYRGVRLFATDDPDLSVKNWTYSVAYRFAVVNGAVPSMPAHSISMLEGAEVDLTKVVQVPSSPGVGTPQALALLAQAEAAASESADHAAVALEVKARADAGEFDGAPGLPGPAGPNTVPTDAAIAGNIATPGTQTSTALNATYAGRPAPVKNALTGWYHADGYGAVGDTVTDNSTVLNSLIAAVIASGGGKIYLPFIAGTTGVYRFNQLIIEGIGNVNLTIEAADGVILRAAPLLTTDAFIIRSSGIYDSAGSQFLRRVTLKNLNIQGQLDWASGTKIDRRGVVLKQVQDLTLKNVKIAQFKRGALIFDEAWDNYLSDVEVKWSGYGLDNSNYAHALQFTSTTGGNSNNNRFINLHMEFCNLEILFDNNARQNFFVSSKLENGGGTEQNTSTISPIWHKAGIENEFIGGMVVQGHSTDVCRVRSDQNADAYLTTYNVRQSLKFSGTLFFANSTNKARWFAGYNTDFINVTVQRANGGSAGYAFDFSSRNTFRGGTITMADNGSNFFRVQGDSNVIDTPTMITAGDGAGSSTAIFTLSSGATRNILRDYNITGSVGTEFAAGGAFTTAGTFGNNVIVSARDNNASLTGGGQKNVLHREYIKLTDSSAATYTGFLNGYAGQKLTVFATTANATLQHGSTANAIFLKSGANKTMAANETLTLINIDGVWREN